jgi:hypothetical protein
MLEHRRSQLHRRKTSESGGDNSTNLFDVSLKLEALETELGYLKHSLELNKGARRNANRVTSSSRNQNDLDMSPLNIQRRQVQRFASKGRKGNNRYTFSSQMKILNKVSKDLKQPIRNLRN